MILQTFETTYFIYPASSATSKMNFFAFFSLSIFLYVLLSSLNAQEILLESTIVRCSQDETLRDGTLRSLLQQASSSNSHAKLDLKLYSKCRKKLQITLRVRESSDRFIPNTLILIDRAKNTLTHKSSRFGRPIAIKFHQEVILQKYALKYLYRVNGKMREEVISHENSRNYTGCFDSPDHGEPPTCGYVPGSSPEKIAGFCCSCQDQRNKGQQRERRGCDKNAKQLSSAHCLRSSLYWYHVYEIFPPTLYQKIFVEVFKSKEYPNGSISWEKMSGDGRGVEVDSDAPLNADGVVKVTYRPHVEGIGKSAMIFNSSTQRLLFPLPNPFLDPDQFPEPEPFKGTLDNQILIVPKTQMSPHGATCDHVGTGIDAFLNQPQRCRKDRSTCLKNQPFDLWEQDKGVHGDSNSKFRLKSYENGKPSFIDFEEDYKTGFIYTGHTANAPTYLDIEIAADDIAILAPGYNALIESVLTDTGSEGAKLVIQVINKELVPATFKVELVQCTLNFSQVDGMNLNVETRSWPKKIGPLNAQYFHLDIHSFAIKFPVYCYITLVNEYGESIAAREVTLKPDSTCLCVHICKCACGEETNVKCEKMTQENIVATGLISAIKTPDQLKNEEESHFTQKYRWVFHWILVFHSILLMLALCGWLQKRCRKSKPETRSFPSKRGEEENDDLDSSGSSNTSQITLFEKNVPSHLLVEGFGPNSRDNIGVTSQQSMMSMKGGPSTTSMPISKEYFSKVWPDTVDTGVSKVTFARQPPPSDALLKQKSILDVKNAPSTNVPMVFSPEGTSNAIITETAITPPEEQNLTTQYGNASNQDLGSPKPPSSESSFPKSASNQAVARNKDGPQASESADLWDTNNNSIENCNSLENFLQYCVSASSSRNSFGTWHRKRRDQYSAYDFLPEPKQKGSFT